MFKRYLAMALALSMLALLPAGASAAGIWFAPLTRSITGSHLGKHKTADLRRGVHRARVAYRGHRYCASLRTLGGVVERAADVRGAVRVERAARTLQRKVFVKHAARRGRCGLARPRFRVAHSVKPAVKRLPPLADGHRRVVARLAGNHGVTTDFVQDELVVEGDRAAAAKLAGRWHGKVLDRASSPSEGELLEPNDLVTLQGTATDPDAGGLTGTWSVNYGATTKVIGTGNTLQFKPSAYVPQGCGNKDATLIFSATDPDGTTNDQVGVRVHYPVC